MMAHVHERLQAMAMVRSAQSAQHVTSGPSGRAPCGGHCDAAAAMATERCRARDAWWRIRRRSDRRNTEGAD